MSTSNRGARGPYDKGVRRREEILNRALQVFAARGFGRTSLRAIAEEIGVSHAALLHYFPSREALLIEVIKAQDQRAEGQATPDADVFERLTLGARYNAGIPGLVALYTSLLGSSVEPGSELAREYFEERFEKVRAQVRDNLVRLLGTQAASDVDLDGTAALIVAAFDGLQVQWLLNPEIDMAGSLALLRKLVESPRGTADHVATQSRSDLSGRANQHLRPISDNR